MKAAVLPDDVEAIERNTIATVSPEAVEEIEGWLLAFDRGVVGRSKCAVPLRHEPPAPGNVSAIEDRYASRGVPTMFRIPDADAFGAFAAALGERGYRRFTPTLVQVARSADVRVLVADPRVGIARRPDTAWTDLFVGKGFDPVEGASRAGAISRARDAVYASIRNDDGSEAQGVGAASFGFGWASIHTMRTAVAHQKQGLAGRILSALAQVAIDRGHERIFLQVDETNTGAQSLYARAGFVTAWRYAYWKKSA